MLKVSKYFCWLTLPSCNSAGYFQAGTPLGWFTVVPRLVTSAHDRVYGSRNHEFAQFYPFASSLLLLLPKSVPNPRHSNRCRDEPRVQRMECKSCPHLFFQWSERPMTKGYCPVRSLSSQVNPNDGPFFVAESGFHSSDLLTCNATNTIINKA